MEGGYDSAWVEVTEPTSMAPPRTISWTAARGGLEAAEVVNVANNSRSATQINRRADRGRGTMQTGMKACTYLRTQARMHTLASALSPSSPADPSPLGSKASLQRPLARRGEEQRMVEGGWD